MSRHNVRVKVRSPHGFLKNVVKSKVDDQHEKLHMFTKVVMEKQALRERYIKLMNDAEKPLVEKRLFTYSEMPKLFGIKLIVN